MDRYWFRNILSVLLFACDQVATQESIYKSLGSSVELVCPIINTTRAITWLGPPNFKVYAVGTFVSTELSTQVALSETDTDKKSILLINRFTKEKSGRFRCSHTFDKSEFNLIIKRNPSDLVIVNATGDKIIAVEGREHNVECRVTSGQPGGNITWSTDGVVVARNGPSSVSYKLIPQRSDDGKIFKCEAFNSENEGILKSAVILGVFYIPKITFSPNQTLTAKEGMEAQLICINDGNDEDATTVWIRPPTNTIISQNNELNFKSINRTDAGLYTCRIDTKAGIYEDSAKAVVQFAPTICIRYFPTERKLKCFPSGVPDIYVFKDWEHTTEYNDHIRFLATTKEGNNATLNFPQNVTGKDHHRNKGIYICRASNNISSTYGMFVMRKYYLNLTGAPYFVSSTENTQYGAYLKTAEIKIMFVSVPQYNNYTVYKNGTKFADYTPIVHRNMKLADNIYGQNVSVKGIIIYLQLKIDTLDDFNMYEIVVKNDIGCANHTIELVSASAPFMPKIVQTVAKQTLIFVLWKPGFNGGYHQWFIIEYKEMVEFYWKNHTTRSSNSLVIGGLQPATNYLIRMFARNMINDSNKTKEIIIQTDKFAIVEISLYVQTVVILSLVIVIAVLLVAGMGLYIRRLKQRHRERMELAINVGAPEGTNDGIAHYTEIIESDNLQPTSQENANSTMAMISRDIDEVSAEHTSTSSDNDRDSSEYIDDGYEQPYTTLMSTDQVKDAHVYLTTEKESNYENAIPFQNVACNSLSDKTNAHNDQENWNQNYDVNNLNKTNESVHQTYIYPQMNKAEYINLSLNQ